MTKDDFIAQAEGLMGEVELYIRTPEGEDLPVTNMKYKWINDEGALVFINEV